ncbi:MAG: WD40/YVTN/BNR-like repeat-containing protein [Leptospirales bacterium]
MYSGLASSIRRFPFPPFLPVCRRVLNRAFGVLVIACAFTAVTGCSEKTAGPIPHLSMPSSTGFRLIQPIPTVVPATSQSPPVPPYIGTLYTIAVPHPGTVFVAGAQSTIWRIQEKTGSWTKIPSPVSDDLYKMVFVDPDKGFIVGDDGVILSTADGGKSWIRVASPIQNVFLQDIDFPDARTGYIVGEKGSLLTTRDGGRTWKALPSPTGQNLYAVYFRDALHGWVAGWGKTFLETRDGGRTFSPVPLSIPRVTRQDPSFNALWGHGKEVVLAGDHGLLYRSSDGGQSFRRIALPAERDLYGICEEGQAGLVVAGGVGTLFMVGKSDSVRRLIPPAPIADFLGVECGPTHVRVAGVPDIVLLPLDQAKGQPKG